MCIRNFLRNLAVLEIISLLGTDIVIIPITYLYIIQSKSNTVIGTDVMPLYQSILPALRESTNLVAS